MQTVNVKEARRRISELLDEARDGAVIAITRRGRVVARLVPPEPSARARLPDMIDFRSTIAVRGAPTSEIVGEMRDEERI